MSAPARSHKLGGGRATSLHSNLPVTPGLSVPDAVGRFCERALNWVSILCSKRAGRLSPRLGSVGRSDGTRTPGLRRGRCPWLGDGACSVTRDTANAAHE